MPFACDPARGITTERRASARLFPLPIKHQTSYINHVSMDPFSYLSPDFDHPGLGNDAGPGRRRRDAAGALASPALLGPRRLGREPVSVSGGGVVIFYRWRNQQPRTFFLFIFVLISPTILYLAPIVVCPPSPLWMNSSITKRTITPIIAYSSFSSQYSRRSISSIPCQRAFRI